MTSVLDVIGVGFGPSNLALAVTMDEQHGFQKLSALFLEQKSEFGWHPNMLLDGAEMQISFLKDLATLRNPLSSYTFLNYLHSSGRLATFANLKSFYPSRVEFHDYLSWVADRLSNYVKYGRRVIGITPHGDEPHSLFEVTAENVSSGRTERYLAKNIVIATGGTPKIPSFVSAKPNSRRVWHTSEHLEKVRTLGQNRDQRYHFAVVGGGQSAAEVACDLHARFPLAKVTCIHRRFGYKPADDSEFVNEIFNAEFVDMIHSCPPDVRHKILSDHYDTNYSVVDAELIQKLYRIQYEESITGNSRLQFKRLSTVTKIQETTDSVKIDVENRLSPEEPESLEIDVAVLATGYSYPAPPHIIAPLKKYFTTDSPNNISVNRYYRVNTDSCLRAGIFVQGCNESTHGLSDTLLSVLSTRAHEILEEITSSSDSSTEIEKQSSDLPVSSKVEAGIAR